MTATLQDFDYILPQSAIAQQPAHPRDSSKLLVYTRKTQEIQHKIFRDIVSLLSPNDVLVRNNTKVIPARLFGKKESGGNVEILLAKHVSSKPGEEIWETLVRPGVKTGTTLHFEHSDLTATCISERGYTRVFSFSKQGPEFYEAVLVCGYTPLPPYIHQDYAKEDILRKQYQTTYAKLEGSSAAPTAGLHFTKDIDEQLRKKGVHVEEVTLHVGLGTFLPVKTQDIQKHEMHSEWFSLDEQTAQRLNTYKKEGKRIIAVGTTSVRVLETCVDKHGLLHSQTTDTNIYIYPPHTFTFVDALITNFHMPKSTLLMLISAFSTTPNTTTEPFTTFLQSGIGKAYMEALQKNYRFFSFGDSMLIQ